MSTVLTRLVVRMDGWPGAPGFMTFYAADPIGFRDAVIAFIDVCAGLMPDNITFTVPNAGELINDGTGTMEGAWSEGSTYTRTGVQTGVWAAPVGAVVTWRTTTIVRGRRLRGRTFVVPLVGAAFEDNGTLSSTNLATLQSAANDLIADADLRVWSRPTASSPGTSANVTSATVPDIAAVLRSRRT